MRIPKSQHPPDCLKHEIRRDPKTNKPAHYYHFPCIDCGIVRGILRLDWKLGKCKRCLVCEGKRKMAMLNSPEGKKRRCKGKAHHFYRKGFTINDSGYRMVSVTLDDPFRCMSDKYGRIREHRLIMARHLGRPLERWEVVHHKNRNRDDNRIENLEVLSSGIHTLVTRMEGQIDRLERENKELREKLKAVTV